MKLSALKPLFLFLMGAIVLQSCIEDDADVTVTYNKGTAYYGNMDAIRSMPLVEGSSALVNPGKIFVSSDYLLIGEENEGIHVINNQNPAAPYNVAFIRIPGNKEFYLRDNLLYAESYYDMLKIDISNPTQPVLVSRAENAISEEIKNNSGETLLGFDFKMVTEKINKDDDVYNHLNNGDGYMVLYDYTNNLIPPSAVPASFAGNSSSNIGSVNRVVEHEGHVYVISRSNLTVLEASSFDKIYSQNVGSEMETIYPQGNHLFIGARSEMSVMDVSDPFNPLWVSSFWHATSCDPVYPTEHGAAYVTLRTGDFAECPGDENALVVLDIENIEQPFALQEFQMISPYGLTEINEKVYVGEGENGFKIFDATNPKELKFVEWVKDIPAYDVLQHPTKDNILLIAGPNGLSQYEIAGTYNHISTVQF
ncbi:MAG: hypothetical protein JXR03_00275 [Cyclobacteriaceae bacterium]